MSRRIVFALDLVKDASLIEAYERRHAAGAVWPEVIRDIRDRGIVSMEIWRVDDRLTMIAEVSERYPGEGDPDLQAVVARWEAEMDRYQRPLRSDGTKWSPMTRIFSLSEQSDQ